MTVLPFVCVVLTMLDNVAHTQNLMEEKEGKRGEEGGGREREEEEVGEQ